MATRRSPTCLCWPLSIRYWFRFIARRLRLASLRSSAQVKWSSEAAGGREEASLSCAQPSKQTTENIERNLAGTLQVRSLGRHRCGRDREVAATVLLPGYATAGFINNNCGCCGDRRGQEQKYAARHVGHPAAANWRLRHGTALQGIHRADHCSAQRRRAASE